MERMDCLESISTRRATMASHVHCVGGHMLNTKVLVFERVMDPKRKKKNKDTNTNRASNGSGKNEEKEV